MTREPAAIGLRVKTGRAIAVVVAGSPEQPRALEQRSLLLHDPALPHSKHPYHVELELDARTAAPLLARALEAVHAATRRELAALVESLASSGHEPRGLALVAGSLGDPAKVGNPHVRAHALEGQLYWQALEQAARALGLSCSVTTEKAVWTSSAKSLERTPEALRGVVAEWGRELGRPWGAEQKTAAIAGWVALR